jgi:hypothetical protein
LRQYGVGSCARNRVMIREAADKPLASKIPKNDRLKSMAAAKTIASIQKNEAFYGEVDILGKPYITGYEPIRDPSKAVIGIYYVGYMK